jgi:chemotaxis methyl-accepting protein methylase
VNARARTPDVLPAVDADPSLDELLAKVERERGFVCGAYKARCLERRILARMRSRGAHSYAEYAALLDRDAVEYDRLVDALTINVTKFFRNAPVFDVVARHVIPALAAIASEEVRVWSAGCSSGEEAYTLAILCREYDEAGSGRSLSERVRILGTDIDRASLAAAERATYSSDSLAEAPEASRRRWFGDGPPHVVAAEVRSLVRFARSDLLADAVPVVDAHLIVCRNVLIYFDRDRQEEVIERMHAALAPEGFLVLGKVEMLLGRTRALFANVEGRERVYRKR